MARTSGSEAILDAVAHWRDRCLLANGSVFTGEPLWSLEHLAELNEHFVRSIDESDRKFLEKLHDQVAGTSPNAIKLMAELLWVMLLFPNNITRGKKVEIVTTVWGWSGDRLPNNHDYLVPFEVGIGSAGMGYNSYRYLELAFLIRAIEAWKAVPSAEQFRLVNDPWAFAEFLDGVDGADKRQLRHMLLHMLFPDTFERVSSGGNKSAIDAAFATDLNGHVLGPDETGTTLLARDRRLFRIRNLLQAANPGAPLDFYVGDLARRWNTDGTPPSPVSPAKRTRETLSGYAVDQFPKRVDADPDDSERSLSAIIEAIKSLGMRLDDRTIRRYHLALATRGFVILSGVSGSGKTWLADAYARVVDAARLIVPVAPNWTTNEDLLGFSDPMTGDYRDTPFSRFLREAASKYREARTKGLHPREYHLILDEMNLARVEYYFARFLSAMETRMRDGEAVVELGPNDHVVLPPTLRFIGTVNIDETTQSFADKVYDRAQLIEITASRDEIDTHLGASQYRTIVLEVWDAVNDVAPFAFRVLDDIGRYVDNGKNLDAEWLELLDEQILQKILPKIRGTDPRVGDALDTLENIMRKQELSLSLAKILAMRSRFEQQGVASFF